MQLPERINLHLNELSDADKSIWRFIESHKETACRASIHDLARLCAEAYLAQREALGYPMLKKGAKA